MLTGWVPKRGKISRTLMSSNLQFVFSNFSSWRMGEWWWPMTSEWGPARHGDKQHHFIHPKNLTNWLGPQHRLWFEFDIPTSDALTVVFKVTSKNYNLLQATKPWTGVIESLIVLPSPWPPLITYFPLHHVFIQPHLQFGARVFSSSTNFSSKFFMGWLCPSPSFSDLSWPCEQLSPPHLQFSSSSSAPLLDWPLTNLCHNLLFIHQGALIVLTSS